MQLREELKEERVKFNRRESEHEDWREKQEEKLSAAQALNKVSFDILFELSGSFHSMIDTQTIQNQVRDLNKSISEKEANHMASMAALNEMFRLKREESDSVSYARVSCTKYSNDNLRVGLHIIE